MPKKKDEPLNSEPVTVNPELFVTQTTRDPNTGQLETDEKEFDKHESRKPGTVNSELETDKEQP